jgi:hypothetical protein
VTLSRIDCNERSPTITGRTNRYPLAFIAILAALACAVPAYAAGPTPLGGNRQAARPQGHRPVTETPAPCVGAARPIAVAGSGRTFSWADAGVGAAAAAGVLLALLGITLIVTYRHAPGPV